MTGNLLGLETSPYLLQHKENPVHWHPWGPAAFEEAAKQNKPILLSVGYAACHWCHVMAHESFEDPSTAEVMNRLFVNIKLDREERPDVDSIYQSALALLDQPGGWPLTMFLAPDGAPFWGGTYFPSEPRYGRPGFRDVLQRIAQIYHEEPDKVRQNVAALRDALGNLSANQPGGAITLDATDQIAQRIAGHVDMARGGLPGAPKFPQSWLFRLLWHSHLRTGDATTRAAVLTTLTNMCLGGIYDHLGGGFARYATDDAWLVPHFEKMLYDNAQLIDLLTLVWKSTGDDLYRRTVEETVGWTLREMRAAETAAGAGFASALDADSEGEEGRFYVWTEAEIDAALGGDAPLFKANYDVRAGGNWEGRSILNRSQLGASGDPAVEAALARSRAILLAVRDGRVRPGWDDKVLADWNGLMIAALARAARVFERKDWQDAAVSAFAFVCDAMADGDRLFHAWRAGRANHPATLDDYACMAFAALSLHETTGDHAYLERAERWVAVLDAHYWDAGAGGYFFTADDTADLILRTKTVYDNATPAGNGLMAENLARLYFLTGKDVFRDRAEALIAAFSGELARNVLPLGSLLVGNELLVTGLQIVVVGPVGNARTEALSNAAFQAPAAARVITLREPDRPLPSDHPAFAKEMLEGAPTAYVCRGPVCGLPLTEPTDLVAALNSGCATS